MANIQSMLSIGALVLLSIISFNFNSAVLSSSTVDVENKVALTAISLGDDLLEEMKGKSFDETTTKFPTTNPSSLTPADSLGPEAGEIYPNFNDIDDYNGYVATVSAPHAENYHVTCTVNYVKDSNVDDVSFTQTFYKRATVTVTSPYMKDTIVLSFVFTLK